MNLNPLAMPLNVAAIGLSAAIAATPNWPARSTPAYQTSREAPSFSYFEQSLKPSWTTQDFAEGIARVYASLLQHQEPLGAEFEAVWDANVADLYES